MGFKAKDFFLRTAVAILFLSVGGLVVALDVEGYSAAVHDRFYVGVDKDFIGDGIDLSGVSLNRQGASSYTYGIWATMVSETHFVSVTHSNTRNGIDEIVFYQDHDPNGLSWSSGSNNAVSEVFSSGDFYLGKLETAPPAWVKRYPLLKRPDASAIGYNFLALPEIDTELTVVGLAHIFNNGNNSSPNLNSILVGKSEVNYLDQTFTLVGQTQSTQGYTHQPLLGVQDQAELKNGDSGAPSFVILDSVGPVLAGLHSSATEDASVSYYLSNIIQEFVTEAGETVTVVTDLVGDTNADFSVNGIELQIVANNFGSTGTYSEGDFNLDGVVNSLDLNILINNYGENLLTPPADFNNDNSVDHQDFIYIATHWGSSVQAGQSGDSTKGGFIDIQDVELFDDLWLTPESIIREVPVQITGDANFDGWVSLQDLNLLG